MYSSCPNIIRHFVPLHFSEATVDYRTTTPLISMKPNLAEMPFTNMKLQSLKVNPRDYILIFKNKTYKEYSPRRKIRYSPTMQGFRTKTRALEASGNQKGDELRAHAQLIPGDHEIGSPRRTQSMSKPREKAGELQRTMTSK